MTGVRRWWLCRAATAQPQLADAAAVAGMLGTGSNRWLRLVFWTRSPPLIPRLNQLFNRANLTVEEIHILRGIAKMMARTSLQKTAAPASGLTADQ
jgi:tRNA/rRNA methyltransferase